MDRSSQNLKEMQNMSVEKFNPLISGELIPYTQVDTKVIQTIKNIEAGFIWVYLLTLPQDWQVIKQHVKNHFGIGDDKLKKIFAYLRRCNLIEYVRERDSLGKLRKSEIRILNGSRFNDPATGVKTHRLADHTCGKPHTTNNIKNKLNKKHKRNIGEEIIFPSWLSKDSWLEFKQHRHEIKKPLTPLAEQKALNELTRLKEKGNDPSAVIDQTIANGWSGFFELKKNIFATKTIEKEKPNETRSNETRSTVMEYGPGHPSWVAQREWERKHVEQGTASIFKQGGSATNGNARGNGMRKAEDYLF